MQAEVQSPDIDVQPTMMMVQWGKRGIVPVMMVVMLKLRIGNEDSRMMVMVVPMLVHPRAPDARVETVDSSMSVVSMVTVVVTAGFGSRGNQAQAGDEHCNCEQAFHRFYPATEDQRIRWKTVLPRNAAPMPMQNSPYLQAATNHFVFDLTALCHQIDLAAVSKK